MFGSVNIDQNVYTVDESGLQRALATLQAFYEQYDRLPKRRDKEVRTIEADVTRGRWKNFGITTWNELLRKVFGRVKKRKIRTDRVHKDLSQVYGKARD